LAMAMGGLVCQTSFTKGGTLRSAPKRSRRVELAASTTPGGGGPPPRPRAPMLSCLAMPPPGSRGTATRIAHPGRRTPPGFDTAVAWATLAVRLPPGHAMTPNQAKPDIPGYRIIRRLGHGGMSEIWLAEQLALARPVAIKVMTPGPESEQRLARFRQEAAIVARFDHPNVVGIIEFGET